MWRAALVAALSLGVARAADDRKKHNKRLKFHAHEAPVLYSLDASPGLVDHAFSALGSLSSIANAATNASSLRFAFILTIPEKAVDGFARALCGAIIAAAGAKMHTSHELPFCAKRSLKQLMEAHDSCDRSMKRLPARVTFVHFPQESEGYPPRVRRVLELLCCAQKRWKVQRGTELGKSLGNHARFFAYLALLPLGARRAVFMDADTLAHDDLGPLLAAPLHTQRFVAAARRCAPKKAAYKPRFKFSHPLVKAMGLFNERQHVNAGVLVVDLERYCEEDLVAKLDKVLVQHLQGPPLWHQGNNQPPFTIAAAAHTLFVHPSWNVRPGDARGQARAQHAQKRSASSAPSSQIKDQCASMLHTPPKILHAHFPPCSALPPRLCPTHPRSSERDPATKVLKMAALDVIRASRRLELPCSCKGKHFDDLDVPDDSAPLEDLSRDPTDGVAAPRGGFPA